MKNMTRPWITLPADKRRIYYNICIIKYFLDIISPNNDFLEKLQLLFVKFPQIDLSAMGFPKGWEQEPIWNIKTKSSLSHPSPEDPSQPSLQREGVERPIPTFPPEGRSCKQTIITLPS